MSEEDVSYFTARAEAELELAQRATTQAAVQAHYELATAYLDRIYGDGSNAVQSAGSGRVL